MIQSILYGIRAFTLLLALSGQVGCAAGGKLVKMDPSLPIETENGYRQAGRPLDRADMVDQLGKERASAAHVSRARTLGTLGNVAAAVGGALIGWPLGEKLGGDSDPTWSLAYAGAGVTALAIPLVIWSISSLNSGVEAHNRELRAPTAAALRAEFGYRESGQGMAAGEGSAH